MPMTTSGLQDVGLADWPAWFRRMNPGYFAAESPDPSCGVGGSAGERRGRRTAPSAKACASPGGNGGACCGALHRPTGVGREKTRLKERVGGGRERERLDREAGRAVRREELGEQIIARLRGIAKQVQEKEKEKGGKSLSSSALIERAAARDTRDWEEEESADGGDEGELGALGERRETGEETAKKGKLVDV